MNQLRFLNRRSRRLGHATSAIAAGAVAVLAAGAVQAQPLEVKGDASVLRPLYANSMDIAQGQRVAQQYCAGCHGAKGIPQQAAVPDLAGQRSAYLLREIRAYASGARGSDVMKGAVTYLSAEAMSDVAAYYGSLAPAHAAPAGKSTEVDPVQAGKTVAATCGACHGESGVTAMPGVPNLVGQEPAYLLTALGEYKRGDRKNDMMAPVAASLTPASMNDVALFYGLQKAAQAATPAAGDAAAGKAASAACAACHGSAGVSGNPSTPSLAGQDAQYLEAALQAYKQGSRSDSTMKGVAAALDAPQMKNLAAYYHGLTPQAPHVEPPLTAVQWSQRCNRCHGVDGNSTDPLIPALASQSAEYLQNALEAYRSGKRQSPVMSAMAGVLSDSDIHNLAAFYASKPARSAVYIILPPEEAPAETHGR